MEAGFNNHAEEDAQGPAVQANICLSSATKQHSGSAMGRDIKRQALMADSGQLGPSHISVRGMGVDPVHMPSAPSGQAVNAVQGQDVRAHILLPSTSGQISGVVLEMPQRALAPCPEAPREP